MEFRSLTCRGGGGGGGFFGSAAASGPPALANDWPKGHEFIAGDVLHAPHRAGPVPRRDGPREYDRRPQPRRPWDGAASFGARKRKKGAVCSVRRLESSAWQEKKTEAGASHVTPGGCGTAVIVKGCHSWGVTPRVSEWGGAAVTSAPTGGTHWLRVIGRRQGWMWDPSITRNTRSDQTKHLTPRHSVNEPASRACPRPSASRRTATAGTPARSARWPGRRGTASRGGRRG